jgi:UDP-N-acetylmuramoyl-L-alanyl-D-glutamate--2,6-diaminopimelate ligase
MIAAVTLADLVREGIPGRVLHGDPRTEIGGVHHDSREVEPRDLFVALPGRDADGGRFAADAVARGAAAVLTERELPLLAVPQLVVADPRRWLALAAAAVYGHPTFALDVVGVTGTNGKTTVTSLVEQALAAMPGVVPASLGTVAMRGPGFSRPASHTTPEGDAIARFAQEVLRLGATHLVMEVSSHALALSRVEAVRFRVAAFTNLTRDHLDFHGTMEAYAAAKERLFFDLGPGASVLNVSDPHGASLAARLLGRNLWRCAITPDADAEIRVLRWSMDVDGLRADVATPRGEVTLRSPLLGAHNLENLVVALGCGLALDLDAEAFAVALGRATGAPGRLERVADPRGVTVLVDYAHTPDALARALAAVRPVTRGRLLCVFGCGGDRDRGKRSAMGEAAGRGADLAIVTSDNPRTEDPDAILTDITPGVAASGQAAIALAELATASRGHVRLVDRRAAIGAAIAAARPGDTVLIAGKGHEDYQIVGTTRHAFDDRVVAREAIAAAMPVAMRAAVAGGDA